MNADILSHYKYFFLMEKLCSSSPRLILLFLSLRQEGFLLLLFRLLKISLEQMLSVQSIFASLSECTCTACATVKLFS